MRVARIRGVDLELHVSLLLLLPYLVFVTAARFPVLTREAGIDPANISGSPVVWGLILAIGLFVSVVLHEFGHVFAAQSLGVRVRSVTLMMLGGVSSMEKVPERPYSEFKLAIVGPLVSIGISGLLFAIQSQSKSTNLIFFCHWLGSLNLMLAIFNLLPAFPLDGGRALRSVLAVRQGMVRATQTSVKISKGFAWALGILGLVGFNILLMLIAFFIYSAAQSELFFLLSRGVLKGLRTGEVALRVDPVPERESLLQAAERMLASRTSVLPVKTESGGYGLVTLSQIRRVPREYWEVTLIRDVMERVTRVLNVNDPMSEVLPSLVEAVSGTLPVVEKGSIIGVLRYSDVSEILQFRSLAHPEEWAEPEKEKRVA